jgi:hypothetical protein
MLNDAGAADRQSRYVMERLREPLTMFISSSYVMAE